MIDAILFNDGIGERRAALLSEGKLQGLKIEREDRPSQIGAIYLGRAQRAIPGLNASFVDLGGGKSGFLAARDSGLSGERRGGKPHEGERILVQVVRDASGDKGPALTRRISLPGHFTVIEPGEASGRISARMAGEARARLATVAEEIAMEMDIGVILRTQASHAERDAIEREAHALIDEWRGVLAMSQTSGEPRPIRGAPDLVTRVLRDELATAIREIVVDSPAAYSAAKAAIEASQPGLASRLTRHKERAPLFAHYHVEEEIEAALEPRVALARGAWMTIETTEGMTAIDVNGGGALEGRGARQAALTVNLEAAAEIARQVSLRGLGGLFVIDFIHMRAAADMEAVLKALERALRADPTPFRVSPLSELGLVEVTRKWRGEPLHRLLGRSCPCCSGRGWTASAETVALEALRSAEAAARPASEVALSATSDVLAVLKAPRDGGSFAERLERRAGCRVALRTLDKGNDDLTPLARVTVEGGVV